MVPGTAARTDESAALKGVRRFYRVTAPIYDSFRSWWSGRTSEVESELDALVARHVGPESRILELGPGTGINLERLRRRASGFRSYLGIDASSQMLERARARAAGDARIDLRLGDVRDLSDASGQYDFIVSTWVLSHLEAPVEVVGRALDLLAPDGIAVFVFSTRPTSPIVRFLVAPLWRLGSARLVDPAPLRSLPGLERLESYFGGLATLAVFRRRS